MAYNKQDIEHFAYGAQPHYFDMWQDLNENQNELYENINQPVLFSVLDMATSNADTSFHTYLRWKLEKNTDNEDVLVFIRAKRTGGTGTLVFKAHVGSENAASSLTSAVGTAYQDITITLTPTGTDTSRDMYLEVKTSDTGTKAIIDSISVYTVPAAPPVGTTTCGFSNVPAAVYGSDEPISTERLSRLMDGPIQITKDRPACVYSFLDNLHTPRSFGTSSTTFESVLTIHAPLPDNTTRDYTLHVYITSDNISSGQPQVRIVVNGKQIGSDAVAAGWHSFEIVDAVNNIREFQTIPVNIQMRVNVLSPGTYQASLGSVQIIRKPEA